MKFLSDLIRPPLYYAQEQNTIIQRFFFMFGVYGPMFAVRAFLGTYAYLAIVIAAGIFHIWYAQREGKAIVTIETMLLYFVVYLIGFNSMWGFFGHFFLADTVATNIGWATGSHFQTELAFYHLSFAILAGATLWFDKPYWGLVIVSKAIFLYGAAYTHIVDIVENANYAPGNAGFEILWLADIIIPTVLVVMYIIVHRQSQNPTEA